LVSEHASRWGSLWFRTVSSCPRSTCTSVALCW